ncbi:MAG: nicotinamide riboside transporter PnuC [Candidatus Nanopelagicaceae bacterium]
MFTIFTAWGYEVSALELSAVITSFTAVLLGARGVRMTWPWYLVSASLYAIFFYQVDLIASALLQFVFIAAGIWGWLGWNKTGVIPRYMNNKERLIWLTALVASWLTTAPILESIGAAATLPDSFLLISSTLAQTAMVLQRNETWIAWIVIDIFGTYHYANQGYWFTALLYGVFTIIAVFGLERWKKLSKSADQT